MAFIKIDRMADQTETDAIVSFMEEFCKGMDPASFFYHLFGRHDAPYGWYVFGVSPIEEEFGSVKFPDGQDEKYIVLGDLLDALPDYHGILTPEELKKFAECHGNDAVEAIDSWGIPVKDKEK